MFFKVKKIKDRWWLIMPSGEIFFSIGLNHFDPSTMKYKENMAVISNPIPISKQVNPGYARLGKKSCNNK